MFVDTDVTVVRNIISLRIVFDRFAELFERKLVVWRVRMRC